MRVLVLADTHVRADRRRDLPPEVWQAARDADLILHAGDVVTGGLLDDLTNCAPVAAVLGNNDTDLHTRLPLTVERDVDGLQLAMIHDSGPTKGRARRLHHRFPEADLVVFGHSHLPVDETGEDGQRLFNPGSCTERRRAPERTYGWLRVERGELVEHEILPVS